MKIKLLTLAMIPTLSYSSFYVLVDNDHYVEGEINVVSVENVISEWSDYGESYNCVPDITDNDVYYNETEEQTTVCEQAQTRTNSEITTYESGLTKEVVEIENQNISTISSVIITGTYLPYSCLELLNFDNSKVSSTYSLIDLNDNVYSAYCDMDTDGGGWTQLIKTALLNEDNIYNISYKKYIGYKGFVNDLLVFGDSSASYGVDSRVSITLPFNYSDFYFSSYKVRGYNEGTHSFDISTDTTNYEWNSAIPIWSPEDSNNSGNGDISFGTTANTTPTTSYAQAGIKESTVTSNVIFPNNNIYSNGISSNNFSIRVTESGTQDENLYVWYSGSIYFR